jgi:hypothetical protein
MKLFQLLLPETWSLLVLALPLGALACGPKSSTRMVDDPSGTAIGYGAPRATTYSASVAASKQFLNLSVFESSRCDVIPITVVQRYQETLHGDKVVQRTPVTKKQVAADPKGDVACNQTYARNVEVVVDVGGNRVSLGETDAQGRVSGDLVQLLQTSGYANAPKQAKVFIVPNRGKPPVEVGVLELHELAQYEGRITQLIAELQAILDKGQAGQSSAEIGKSYEIYSQLLQISYGDARVEGIGARFWELWYGRKQDEARQSMEKNLDSLSKAQETLKAMGDAAIPIYVQAAVNSGTLDRRSLEWSSLRLIAALKSTPNVCAGGYNYGQLDSYGWPVDARLAAHCVNHAYGAQPALVTNACR